MSTAAKQATLGETIFPGLHTCKCCTMQAFKTGSASGSVSSYMSKAWHAHQSYELRAVAYMSNLLVNAAEDLMQRLTDLETRLKQCKDAAAALEAEKAGRLRTEGAASEPASHDAG